MNHASRWLEKKTLVRYLAYCLLGPGLPMVLALFTIPRTVQLLGVDRFGILSLIWVVLGYFSLFDLGLGRAAVRLVAEKIGEHKQHELAPIVGTTVVVTGAAGCMAALILKLLIPTLLDRVFHLDASLRPEAYRAFSIMAFCVPFITLMAACRGILETQQHFRLTNSLQALLGALTYIAPLAVLLLGGGLGAITAVLTLTRALVCLLYLKDLLPHLRRHELYQTEILKRLLRMGGWMTVSNTVGPLMVYFDRFLIGSVLSLAAVTYYSTPYEAIFRLTLLSSAVGQVFFPAMSTFFFSDRAQSLSLLRLGTTSILAAVLPAISFVVLLAPELLKLWLGAEFVSQSRLVLQILALGVFCNMMALMPFLLIQSAERAALSAKLHVVELVLYLPAVWFAAHRFGINGVAVVWSARCALDMLGMFRLSVHLTSELKGYASRIIAVTLATAVILFAISQLEPLGLRVLLGLAWLGLVFVVIWKIFLPPSAHDRVLKMWKSFTRRIASRENHTGVSTAED